MENEFKDDKSEVFWDSSSCPEEDRSWKRRQKKDDGRNKNNSSRNNSTERKPIRERLGRLDSQGNHIIPNKPR